MGANPTTPTAVGPNVNEAAGGFVRPATVSSEWSGQTAQKIETRWYAAYTSANHEKRVAEQMRIREVEHFLPTYSSMRRWKDRRVKLDMPLFPGYVFVRMCLRERLRVVQIPGVARLVGFDGTPVALPDEEIELLRRASDERLSTRPHPYLKIGQRARVIEGPLRGAEGILIKQKSNFRVILSIELIMRSVSVEVNSADLELLFAAQNSAG